ncbi:MAG: hypothetical protein JKY51_05840 [Opitutaceae bacterium]|nr:hypothetical protein [Opitutaceae bacterium]
MAEEKSPFTAVIRAVTTEGSTSLHQNIEAEPAVEAGAPKKFQPPNFSFIIMGFKLVKGHIFILYLWRFGVFRCLFSVSWVSPKECPSKILGCVKVIPDQSELVFLAWCILLHHNIRK